MASDIFGVSGREMMTALVGGQTNPKALAQLARGRLRAKLGALQEAFSGHFTDHHGFLLGRMLLSVVEKLLEDRQRSSKADNDDPGEGSRAANERPRPPPVTDSTSGMTRLEPSRLAVPLRPPSLL